MKVRVVRKRTGEWLVEDRPLVQMITLRTTNGVDFEFAVLDKTQPWETCFIIDPKTGRIFDGGKDPEDTIARAKDRLKLFLSEHWVKYFENQFADCGLI